MVPDLFAARGPVPVAYAAFAFAVGVFAGTLVRRTVRAMAVTVAIVVAVQIAVPALVRPHIIPPERLDISLGRTTIAEFYTDQTAFTATVDQQACDPGSPTYLRSCVDWISSQDLHQEVHYHPASRFWALQWAETSLVLAVTALLLGACFWWVRRRLV